MKYSKILSITVLNLLILTGCQQQFIQSDEKSSTPVVSSEDKPTRPLPFPEQKSELKELDQNIVFEYLAAEIGAQRGQLRESFEHYLRVASKTRDSYAANRAARIALHLNDQNASLRASRLWVEIDPNSIPARQLHGLLELSQGQLENAKEQFDALLLIADARGQDGYLLIAGMLVDEKLKGDSVRLMRLLLEDHQDSAHAHYALAAIEADSKLYEDALLSLESSIALDPDWDKPRILHARVLIDLGQPDLALISLRKSINHLPRSFDLHMAYSREFIAMKRYPEALDALAHARKLEPDNTEVLLSMGLIETELKRYDKARTTWQTLRNIKSAYSEATYYLAQTEELDNNPEVAIGLYAAVKHGPLLTDAGLRKAQLLANAGRTTEAHDLYRELRVLNPKRASDIYTLEARSLINNGHVTEAFALYETAINANPDDIELRYNRGIIASENDRLDMALEDFAAILQKHPDHTDTLNAMGYTLAEQTDRYDEAYIYILQAYKAKPDSPAILDSLGWIYYRLGNLPEALKYLQLANSKFPDAEIASHLGEVLWMTGKKQQARQLWTEALDREPDNIKLLEVMQRLQ